MKNTYEKIIQISPAPTITPKSTSKTASKLAKHFGLLSLNNKTHNCSLGRTGITAFKREGDGATPMGSFKVLYGFYRSDRIKLPATGLSMIPISNNLGWCDAPQNANYNRAITVPYHASHEIMMRDDRLYDICLVLDYNIARRKSYVGRYKGSAIFLHQTKKKNAPTQGCIAIEPNLMLHLLPRLDSNTIVKISN